MSTIALVIEQDRSASPFFPFLPRSHSFNDQLAALRAASSGADSQASDSSRSGSLKRRSVRWNRTKWSREPSQTDVSNGAFVQLEEGDFPLSHTRTLAVDADNDVECGDSDCEIGYHSDTVDHEQLSKLITLRQVLAARQARMYEHKDEDEDTDDALDEPYEQNDMPRHTFVAEAYAARRTRQDSDDGSSGRMDMDVDSVHHDEYEDDDEEEAESEYEAPVLRKRKRKDLATTASTHATAVAASSVRPQSYTGRPSRAKFTISGPPSVGTPDAEDSPDVSFRPPLKKTGINRRMHGKRPRLDNSSDNDKVQFSGLNHPNAATVAVTPSVLEFPCRYISPEGRACAKKFPRWTDYEKHYESCHIGDSGYPWSYKVEAKDCPFRCPHPIPSASRPKSQKGRLVKTVEYGPCDFVTRKNTHDFERHWKGNHIRSEALFIARGNMQLEDAKWVNVKEKFEIAYALCPRCPRCSENFTRTDALTRHLRSPCSGGSVGAAIDDHLYAVQPAPTAVQFVEVKDAKAVKDMLDSQATTTAPATHGPHHHPHHNAMLLHANSQTLVTA